ncbi:kinase-like domain-containing protein [Aspergillus coremiiformis]|uniref:non-specific serine/threonine protein kinase n=1 Tax=Aspergillus coremiiformis TaxID=138285 RepID=A0A5N6ZIL4_9EURO|nr:kinase-like domain-containing protein [Aspergillus coremiiformis]
MMASQHFAEGLHSYHPNGFHLVHLGDIFHCRYKVLRKLGYGRYSTVWLVEDQSCSCYRALKILSAECYGGSSDLFELEVLKRLQDFNPKDPGHRYIPTLVDTFEHVGPNGRHVCLVLEPMGETLASFGTLFSKCQIPAPIIQRFAKQLLLALDYAHRSGVIHGDIQPRNIMIQIPNCSIIDKYLKETPADLAASNPKSDSSILVSQPLRDFYIPESSNLRDLNIALCDWGSASWTDKHLTEVIQPVLLRAPEVIIRAPWGPPVDIWNLGAVLLEALDAVHMFDGRATQTGGVYKTQHHLEEIVALFGPFPSWLLTRGKKEVVEEYFDENGRIRNPIPRPEALLENWIESLAGDDKAGFIMFLKRMMKIDPRDRLTPTQLLDEPWLQHTS